MFRERIAHWTGILDVFHGKWNTVAVLARLSGSLIAGTYQSKHNAATHTNFDPRRDTSIATAIAYAQVSARYNR